MDMVIFLELPERLAKATNGAVADYRSILGSMIQDVVVKARDINQLASRGIPIYQWLANSLSKTQAEIKDALEAGRVHYSFVFNAIDTQTKGDDGTPVNKGAE